MNNIMKITLPHPPLFTLGPTSPVSSFPVEDHLVGTPTLDHNGRAAAKHWRATAPNLFVCVLTATCTMLKPIGGGLPTSEHGDKPFTWRAAAPTLFVFVFIATCTMDQQDLTPCLAPPQHPRMQPHFTPTTSPPTLLHLVAISILAMNCLSGTCRGASSLQPLRTEVISPQIPNPHTPWQSIQKSLGCAPLFPSPKCVRLWGVHRHRTCWRLVGVPF